MDNNDSSENGMSENVNQLNNSPRLSNGSIPKQTKQGKTSTKQHSNNKACSIS
jgi:hypothetical protein